MNYEYKDTIVYVAHQNVADRVKNFARLGWELCDSANDVKGAECITKLRFRRDTDMAAYAELAELECKIADTERQMIELSEEEMAKYNKQHKHSERISATLLFLLIGAATVALAGYVSIVLSIADRITGVGYFIGLLLWLCALALFVVFIRERLLLLQPVDTEGSAQLKNEIETYYAKADIILKS